MALFVCLTLLIYCSEVLYLEKFIPGAMLRIVSMAKIIFAQFYSFLLLLDGLIFNTMHHMMPSLALKFSVVSCVKFVPFKMQLPAITRLEKTFQPQCSWAALQVLGKFGLKY